jgi:hypothetical protein
MTAIAITGMGLTGVLRLTWVHGKWPTYWTTATPTKPRAPGPAWPAPATGWRWAPTWTTGRCGSWPQAARSPT